jgi:hypothetical protein
MATGDTVSTSLDDALASELVANRIIETARAAIVIAPMVAFDSFRGSNVKSYPRLAKVTAASLTEGTDGTFTTMTDTQVSVTLAELGIGVRMSDVVQVTSAVEDIAMRIADELGKAFADKIEIDLLAKVTSLTDGVGSTGVALTEDVWLQGVYETEANDIGGRTIAFIGFPKQLHNITTAIAGTTENNSVVYGRSDMLNRLAPSAPNGYKFTLYGVDCFQSTNVPTANTGADSNGQFLVVGPDSPHLLAVGELGGSLWWARREIERDASFRGVEAWVTGYCGYATVAPERGCRVLSVR